ncbi:uncharacterized protein LOC134659900 [Cydia amplana]|uniref:uncharacterized protein LOC134659900 n=1 Tax=Cydia amplana TaxID=1869771 RepID=UPI002FE5D323
MPNKYFIYAGGRWCEVDTRRGRVEGFRQRARFCYLRGGRLEVGRTATILRALRSLAAGAGGAARDSAPLLHRRRHKPRRESARAHRCCSQHPHHSRCDVNANELGDKPTAKAVQPQEASPRKRKRSSSEESHTKAKQIKSDELTQISKSPQKKAVEDKEELIVISLLEDSKEKKSPQKKAVKVRDPEQEKLVQSLLESSSSEDIKEQTQSPTLPGPRSRKVKEIERSPQKLQKAKTVDRGKEEQKLVQSLLQTSSDDEQVPNKSPKPSPKSRPQADSDSSSSSSAQKELCKELVIDDHDVRVLRGFLARTAGADDLKRFDKDEEYKTRVFYKLNPLVCLKRCGPLEKLLTQRLTLKEFAKHLGLRSVADVTPEKRYRMRHSTREARNTASITSDSEKEKVIAVQPKRRQLWNRNRELFDNSPSTLSSELKVKPQIHRPARISSRDTTDSDTEVKQHIRRHLERRASARLNPERKETRSNKNDDSIVVESNSDETSQSGNQRQTRRKSKGTAEDNESMLVRDDNSSNADSNERKIRRKSKGTKEDNQSVLVSDESDSVVVQKQRKSRCRIREKRKTAGDESVVISDESDSTNESAGRSTRRTRSQDSEKRVLRERNKSVIISDSDRIQNRRNTRTKSNETDKRNGKSILISDSNTDENQVKNVRTRSKDPNKDMKNIKANDTNANKESDRKTKKDVVSSPGTKKTTRPSMKIIEDNSKNDKAKNTKNDEKDKIENTSNKRKEEKPGPSRREHKESPKKPETGNDQDKSEISDSSDAFEKSKLSQNKYKEKINVGKLLDRRRSAMNMPRNHKGKFIKRPENSDNKSIINEKENADKANDDRAEKAGQKDKNKGNDKNRTDTETDKEKYKVLKDRIDRDKDERERRKGSNNKKTENMGKENDRKAVAPRSVFLKPVKFKKSCVANGREYTSLEDHSIVAWISVGNRMRMVNGNTIWRELQSEYTRLTSQTRSWHSLRNRYLRYILPSLGQLALPPSQVSRLRAAAAVGELATRHTARSRCRSSWHSLRNRYLRYILPSLGQLALPPSQVSRLRAAAAVGELATRHTARSRCRSSWHSLRNRYLRYILPSLGQLALPPSQVSRLRAAAAVGELATRHTARSRCRSSWHSLRNRYLRYILPSLGQLALPPSQVSRLRAAAAVGELATRHTARSRCRSSWHSLRNRYLRYILPSLGQLALPPSQVSRLRAAAAVGELATRHTARSRCRSSWHSLRNRYLRYILPSLGQLALPPSQVSRLRAAAAVGELATRHTARSRCRSSWHSLRNRYLRYILPSLGQLALPPSQVSRLRAAAAVGELATRHTARSRCRSSWHSLRNRYLRYILPSLGQLALPPSQVSRLRAAAAVGELATRHTARSRCRSSWHSLRNRYLRYILPSLGQLALPPSQVSRLRAAAAVGELATRHTARSRCRSSWHSLRNRYLRYILPSLGQLALPPSQVSRLRAAAAVAGAASVAGVAPARRRGRR